MSLQDVLGFELRTRVGPVLRAHGFTGSGRRWRCQFENGDSAVVNVQSSAFNSSTDLSFVINLAYVVPVLREWWNHDHGRDLNSVPTEVDGIWRARLHAGGVIQDKWWEAHSEDQVRAAATEVIELLEARAIPTLQSFCGRDALIEAVATHQSDGFGYVGYTIWDVPLLLSDQGMTPRLEKVLAAFEVEHASDAARTESFVTWIRERAERIDQAS